MKEDLIQNEHPKLFSKLNKYSYENLFTIAKYEDDPSYFYNLINAVYIPENLDNTVYDAYVVNNDGISWTNISFQVYGTIRLWWVICITNQIQNPISFPKAGTTLKILKPQYVQEVLTSVNRNNA